MKRLLRMSMSIVGSIVLSMLASLALRRLLLESTAGGEEGGKRRLPVIVVMPVVVGNQWVFGQPKPLAPPAKHE